LNIEIDLLFWGATALFFVLEYILSRAIAEIEIFPEQGLVTDISAAVLMLLLAVGLLAFADLLEVKCSYYGSVLSDFNSAQCIDQVVNKVVTLGDVLRTTLGMNPVFAAIWFYLLAYRVPKLLRTVKLG